MNYHYESQQLEKASEILDCLKEAHRRMDEAESYIYLVQNAKVNDWQKDNRLLFAPPLWKLEHEYDIKKGAYARWLIRLAKAVGNTLDQCCKDLEGLSNKLQNDLIKIQ